MTLLLLACRDNPTGPESAVERVPAVLEINSGNEQTAIAGYPVSVAPSVIVKDREGRPVAGIAVGFTVVSGDGAVSARSAVTDAQGIASAAGWTVGRIPGRNELEASVTGLASVRFMATSESAYSITVRYVGTVSAREREAVCWARRGRATYGTTVTCR